MVLNSRGYVVQDLFGRGFKKLVPLGKNSKTPNVESRGILDIADNPKYWTAERLADYYHRFHNVATTFGPQLSPEGDGTIVYNHCLDIDSDSVRKILEPYLPEILKLTCVVKTKKGLHVHWCEHTQHERVGFVSAGRKNRRCTVGYEFEIKTDHRGGLSHLPPSEHRDDVQKKLAQPFKYQWMEDCAHKLGIIDNFMGSGLGFYDWLCQDSILGRYIREPSSMKGSQIREPLRKEHGVQNYEQQSVGDGATAVDSILMSNSDQEESEIQTSPSIVEEEQPPSAAAAAQIIKADIAAKLTTDLYFECADRIYSLVDPYYVQPHRNNAMLAITGAIRRSNSCGIRLDDARHIVEQFCSIAGDEEIAARLAMLESTYEKEDVNHNGTFAIFDDIVAAFNPSIEDEKPDTEVDKIEKGVYAALDNFFAIATLTRRPLIEIDKSKSKYIVIFYDTVEEVDFPTLYSKALGEYYRKVERKSLLLSAAPVPPIVEVWDPIYQKTKYMMTLRHVGQGHKIITRKLDKFMTRDELVQWLRGNASYYYRLDKLAETIHAVVNAYIRHGLVDHRVGTEIEGLVFLPTEEQGPILALSNMERPPVPTQEQARVCINVIDDVHKKFYSDTELEVARHAHFIKVGVVAPIDFARRQSGAVNQYDIIPRQDLGGWTDVGKTFGYAAIPLRMYGLSLNKGMGHHSYIVGSGSIDTAARFIEQTRWTTMPVVFDEADRYSEWEEDKEARRILSVLKNSTQITNPRDTLTSDSEQVEKPSAAYVLLTHNSALIQEDGFNKRCIGHEFTTEDEKKKVRIDAFNTFWNDEHNRRAFKYLGDFVLNYYLDNPQVLNNHWLDIAKTVLQAFWVSAAGFSEQEFKQEWWDKWLGKTVQSATSKDDLIRARTANIVSMLRQMVNDAWARHRQQLTIWIAKNKRNGAYSARELDEQTGKLKETLDEISAGVTFKEKLEALVESNLLTFLVWHPKFGITIDSSIINEMENRYHIHRVTHKGLEDLLGFSYGSARFGRTEVKKIVYATIEQFVDRVAPKGEEEEGEV